MIEMDNLCKTYGTLEALKNLTLTVPRGELFCFLGPNGAGKTTTLKILTGLIRASSGTARVAGIDVRTDPVAVKQRLGYIPELPFVYERLTPAEFMRFTGDLYDMPSSRVASATDEWFDRFDLQDHRDSFIKDLSHGMRQRLIYSATFMHEPEVLLIDEPLMGLDPRTIRLIKDLLIAKARAGMTIFLTTHILALAESVADRIGIITNGRLCALGTLKELKTQHPGTSTLEDVFLRLTGGSEQCRP